MQAGKSWEDCKAAGREAGKAAVDEWVRNGKPLQGQAEEGEDIDQSSEKVTRAAAETHVLSRAPYNVTKSNISIH